MSNDRILRQIKARLSLRPPQADSLDLLEDILNRIAFDKHADPATALAAIQAAWPSVTDFERDFPSLCFALATGVGKTRLMGAFISYLYLSGRSRNFFVLAPNTTIYDKLTTDFTPNTEKYVFKGIAEFASSPPILVTGDTWDQGRGVRGGDLFGRETAIVNIFNVDKINKDGGRIKKLHEYIGQSYFDYLAELPDLVLLMDEAHRYRGKAGWKAVGELRPVVGLELTATPRSVGTRSERFKNVIFDYSLGQAMADGFVKEPAVATREDFRADSVTPEQLERIKLEDGIHCHENVKAELDIYARQSGRQKIHPFMLVVAQDTTHAEALRQAIEADDFFGGRYKGRVIHVNKLKEGWDVRNLYTIVPLRASASDILTEQTLGRGLRLPYGTRTGVEAVDTLTVIAHDRFDEVIKAARDPNSIIAIRKLVTVGAHGDVSPEGATVLDSRPLLETALTGQSGGFGEGEQPTYTFETHDERKAADFALRLIQDRYERELKKGIHQLNEPEVKARITAARSRPR
jgi:type III restriction enzyme